MNIYHKIKLMATALLFATAMYGQQDPNYTFYRYNMNIYNPAFAGSSDVAELSLGMRSQWAGVEGAPQSQSAIFDMPLGKSIGVGASILNDKTFIEQQTWVGIDVSYNIQLSEDHRLYFGIKGSANSYDANTQGLVTYGVGQDGALMDFKGRFTPNVGAGLYLKHYRYFVSLSAPKLFTPDRLQEEDGNAYLGTDRLHTYLSGGYTFILGGKIDLKTMGMLRYVNAAPLSTELTAILDFGQRFELGTSYRFNESVSGLFLLNISSGFRLGYAYEAATQSAISSMESGTHELFMKIQL